MSQRQPPTPLLRNGYVLQDDFTVVRFIGRGGFAHIFEAYDSKWRNNVALKVAIKDGSNDNRRMIIEVRALLALTNTDHSPEVLHSGESGGFMYIVMDLLGSSLKDLKHRRLIFQHRSQFTPLTSIMVALQMVDALEAAHRIGFLHRDVKPANMCIGRNEFKSTIYLVDYNMARRYKDTSGRIYLPRAVARFRGTHRYASLTTHEQREQGPKDDLWSLYYTLAELSEGALPWHAEQDREVIQRAKKRTTESQIFTKLPAPKMKKYADHLRSLNYNHVPNYNLLKTILLECLPDNMLPPNPVLDWQIR